MNNFNNNNKILKVFWTKKEITKELSATPSHH